MRRGARVQELERPQELGERPRRDPRLGAEELHPFEGFTHAAPLRVDPGHRLHEHVADERLRREQHGGERVRGASGLFGRLRQGRPWSIAALTLPLGGRVVVDHVVVDRDVPGLVPVDELHRVVTRLVVEEVVDGSQQRDVEQELAGDDVGVGDLRRHVAQRREEPRAEVHEARARSVGREPSCVEMPSEPLGGACMPLLVDHEGREDLTQHRIGRVSPLLREERAGEPLDLGHVGEVLDDLALAGRVQRTRRSRPIDVVQTPLPFPAPREHSLEVHGSSKLSLGG